MMLPSSSAESSSLPPDAGPTSSHSSSTNTVPHTRPRISPEARREASFSPTTSSATTCSGPASSTFILNSPPRQRQSSSCLRPGPLLHFLLLRLRQRRVASSLLPSLSAVVALLTILVGLMAYKMAAFDHFLLKISTFPSIFLLVGASSHEHEVYQHQHHRYVTTDALGRRSLTTRQHQLGWCDYVRILHGMAPQTPITTTKRRKTAAGGKGWEKAKWVPKIEEEDGDENQPSLARDSIEVDEARNWVEEEPDAEIEKEERPWENKKKAKTTTMSTTTVNGITEFSIDEPPAAQRRRSSSYVKHDSDSDEDGDGLRHLKRPKPSQKGRRKKNRRRQPPPRAIVKDPDEQDSREVEVDDGRVVGVMTGLDDHGDDYGPYGGSSVVMSVAALQNRLRHLNATALPYEGGRYPSCSGYFTRCRPSSHCVSGTVCTHRLAETKCCRQQVDSACPTVDRLGFNCLAKNPVNWCDSNVDCSTNLMRSQICCPTGCGYNVCVPNVQHAPPFTRFRQIERSMKGMSSDCPNPFRIPISCIVPRPSSLCLSVRDCPTYHKRHPRRCCMTPCGYNVCLTKYEEQWIIA